MHKSGASNIKYFALLRTKIGLNLRAEADRYKLGYLWWILEPLLFAAAMYVVFVIYLGLRTDDVVAFLLTGMIPFQWFAKSVSNSMGSIKGAKGLLINFPINPTFFPLVHMGQDAVKQVFTFGFLLVFLLLYGMPMTYFWLLIPVAMLLQLMLIVPIGCFVAGLIPMLEDLRFLVSTSITMTLFASGIFYNPREVIDGNLLPIFYANPMASLLQIYRDLFMYAKYPDPLNVYFVLLWALLFTLLSTLLLGRMRNQYARLVMQ